ncbi:hypothetical protein [Aurantiacibacter marinus]|uniref:Uncharacterized protein n=1 Tax=Aurantiacibacter marinus TaxID=874156 RepID=A0A0H0XQ54_9SPHN|nr:hypothetical protein [Aurantiacibacter marinus]KLI64459.1 hypothetical protein AAV99_02350 [Aurantiacibacter marinus]
MQVGKSYRVVLDTPAICMAGFVCGEQVTLRHVGYSHYDCSHIYLFDTKEGAERRFWLHDDSGLEELTNMFLE